MTLKKRLARATYPLRRNLRREAGAFEAKQMLKRAKQFQCALTPVFDNTANIKPNDRILMTMGRDESTRIPYFLNYYRSLGIDHFLFVDNNSKVPMAEQLSGQPDVSLWHTTDSYIRSKFGVDWMNSLLSRYAVNHWALTVDLDEFFVYPYMENRSLSEFIFFLDDVKQKALYAPLIDLYPCGPISSAVVPTGASPLKYANYFDTAGYFPVIGGYEDTWVRGGPRCRIFAEGDIGRSPTINKTPLIKWARNYAYLSSTHTAAPFHLNHIYQNDFLGPSGALLHFKFISNFKEKAQFAVENKNHYNGSKEYENYLKKLEADENLNLMCPISSEYLGTKSLIEHNLMSTGLWS